MEDENFGPRQNSDRDFFCLKILEEIFRAENVGEYNSIDFEFCVNSEMEISGLYRGNGRVVTTVHKEPFCSCNDSFRIVTMVLTRTVKTV